MLASTPAEGMSALVTPFVRLVNFESMAKELYAVGFLPVAMERVKHHDPVVSII